MDYSYLKNDRKTILAFSIIIATLLAGVAVAPGITGMFVSANNSQIVQNNTSITSPITTRQPYCFDTIQNYTEIVPYTDKECVTGSTTERVCETKDVSYYLGKECYWSDDLKTLNARCSLKNLDATAGEFSIELGIYNKNNENIGERRVATVDPQETVQFTYSYAIDMGVCYCNAVKVPTKEICYDKTVNKEQCFDVTKYMTVNKSREIRQCD